MYRTIRTKNSYKKFIKELDRHEKNHSEEYYYSIRNMDKDKTAYSKLTRVQKSARAKMRMMIKKLLKKYNYPPKDTPGAVEVVMSQCELWADRSI